MSTTLLPELLDEIVGHLRREGWRDSYPMSIIKKQDLSSCTLVCRAWCAVAQPHLFRDVVYSFCPPCVEVRDLAAQGAPPTGVFEGRWTERDGESVPCKTLPLFVEFLRRSPRLAQHVRRLSLRSQMWSTWELPAEDATCIEPALLTELLGLLAQLQELWLKNVEISKTLSPEVHPRRHSISQLAVAYAHPTPISHLAATLSLFTSIDTLILQTGNLTPSTHPFPPFHTRELWLIAPAAPRAVLDALLAHTLATPPLTSLHLMCAADLSPIPPNVEHVRVSLVYVSAPPPLVLCTRLRTLTLFAPLRACDATALVDTLRTAHSVLVTSRLSRASHPELTDLVFEVFYDAFYLPGALGVVEPRGLGDELDTALVGIVRQTRVESVRFKWIVFNELIVKDGEYEEVRGLLMKLFPVLWKEGLARFRPCSVARGVEPHVVL